MTYLKLIPQRFRRRYPDRAIQRMRYSNSLFVVYFGTDRKYDHMAHHEILMGHRYRDWVDDLFVRKTLPDDFSLYLHRPSATDPSLAPPPAATAGMCWPRSPIWIVGRTGRMGLKPINPKFLTTSRPATCLTCGSTSSPSITLTPCISAIPSTATKAARFPWNRRCFSRPGFAPIIAARMCQTFTSLERVPIRGLASRGCSVREKILADLIAAARPTP